MTDYIVPLLLLFTAVIALHRHENAYDSRKYVDSRHSRRILV